MTGNVTYYYDDGTASHEMHADKKTCAFCSTPDRVTKYYILSYGGFLFNPSRVKEWGYTKQMWKMRQVNQQAFELYLKFLTHHRQSYLTQAERAV